jgi:predicted nucleotide-binding protein (sugar kinase/HSP70/actin superfamily)
VYNYLNRVVERRHIGQRIMFLGGPSLNQGIVAAFERVLRKPIVVPRHREVMGAFGAALSVREMFKRGEVRQQARDLRRLADLKVDHTESICHADKTCHNECKLKIYNFGGRKSVWGGDCGRYEVSRHQGTRETDFFQERQILFQHALEEKGIWMLEPARAEDHSRPTIGVPLALHSLEWGIFWGYLLAELNFSVRFSPRTNNRLVLAGLECMTAETCFPVKVFHGHVRHLLEQTDYLFLPSVINMPTPVADEVGFLCPLVQSSQYMVRSALNIPDERMIRPIFYMKEGHRSIVESLNQSLPEHLRPGWLRLEKAVATAWDAQAAFRRNLEQRGKEILHQILPTEPLWIITGRPYNLYDERQNLQLGKQLAKLGIKALPMDFLELDSVDLSDFPSMYWGLGAKILRTAKLIARTPNWYGLHLTNFSCGADSFIEHFYRHILGTKPSLILELDEHSAVAGVLTRIEAYKNVVQNLQQRNLAVFNNSLEALG